ncbi:hypothetical protein HDU96_009787 [Phlyctochytrium bullatum]|nr:hypothetical protein HDU96_009787 [Phlyctochytrium bullatum]
MPGFKEQQNIDRPSNNISTMVKPIAQMSDSTVDTVLSALSEIQARWPEIKEALAAVSRTFTAVLLHEFELKLNRLCAQKKAVDDAFSSAISHESAAFDFSKEITDLEAKRHPIGDLIHLRKRKIRELRAKMDEQFRASTAAEGRAVEMSQQFLSRKASYDVLEAHMSKFLAALTDLPETSAQLEALRASRGVYDVAKSRYPDYKKAEALCLEIVQDSKVTRRKLIEEYPGEGYEHAMVDGGVITSLMYVHSYIDPKTQQEAISTSNIAAQKSQKIFELCPELPPQTIQPKNLIDPDSPAARRRKPTAVSVQNAVTRLDAFIDNHEVTLAHIRKELGKFRGDLLHEAKKIAEAVLGIWDATVPLVAGRLDVGRAEVEEMRGWMPEIALSINAFRL